VAPPQQVRSAALASRRLRAARAHLWCPPPRCPRPPGSARPRRPLARRQPALPPARASARPARRLPGAQAVSMSTTYLTANRACLISRHARARHIPRPASFCYSHLARATQCAPLGHGRRDLQGGRPQSEASCHRGPSHAVARPRTAGEGRRAHAPWGLGLGQSVNTAVTLAQGAPAASRRFVRSGAGAAAAAAPSMERASSSLGDSTSHSAASAASVSGGGGASACVKDSTDSRPAAPIASQQLQKTMCTSTIGTPYFLVITTQRAHPWTDFRIPPYCRCLLGSRVHTCDACRPASRGRVLRVCRYGTCQHACSAPSVHIWSARCSSCADVQHLPAAPAMHAPVSQSAAPAHVAVNETESHATNGPLMGLGHRQTSPREWPKARHL